MQALSTKILILNSGTVGLTGDSLYVNGSVFSSSSASTWSQLTWNPTTVWSAQSNVSEDKKILYLTGNSTLSITNLYNGWAGLLEVIQSGNSANGYSLFLPANTKVQNGGAGSIYLTSGSGVYDLVGFQYDGVVLFANLGNNFS